MGPAGSFHWFRKTLQKFFLFSDPYTRSEWPKVLINNHFAAIIRMPRHTNGVVQATHPDGGNKARVPLSVSSPGIGPQPHSIRADYAVIPQAACFSNLRAIRVENIAQGASFILN